MRSVGEADGGERCPLDRGSGSGGMWREIMILAKRPEGGFLHSPIR